MQYLISHLKASYMYIIEESIIKAARLFRKISSDSQWNKYLEEELSLKFYFS